MWDFGRLGGFPFLGSDSCAVRRSHSDIVRLIQWKAALRREWEEWEERWERWEREEREREERWEREERERDERRQVIHIVLLQWIQHATIDFDTVRELFLVAACPGPDPFKPSPPTPAPPLLPPPSPQVLSLLRSSPSDPDPPDSCLYRLTTNPSLIWELARLKEPP
ncbi:hypothetical protein B0T19DRAFT_297375 [Cercophora scortea]|uniref:Uncharacterized protein n=1 Tax=Cercophora scortea TaxID=314031 RepID=A0AAE0I392_9PEZI|nr:hypothetical protein B0T19DRAFT_297375 [Cercophora scortea]